MANVGIVLVGIIGAAIFAAFMAIGEAIGVNTYFWFFGAIAVLFVALLVYGLFAHSVG